MLLDYIYNNLILNFSLKHSNCTGETVERAKFDETASLKNFYKLIHTSLMFFLHLM